jgi:hypothetical protein
VLTNRVYPLEDAKSNGTLCLLLNHIKKYFRPFNKIIDEFKDETSDDFVAARDKGPAGIRRLLLSREWECLKTIR